MDPRVVLLITQYWLNIQTSFRLLMEQRRERIRRMWAQIFQIQTTTMITLGIFIALTTPAAKRKKRRVWMKKRCSLWWEHTVLRDFKDSDWVECFRMRRNTFQYICDKLRVRLEPDVAFLKPREPISVEKQVAITLYYLASCCKYSVVANAFGIHKTSVWRCVHKVVDAINELLLPVCITMPDEKECVLISQKYESITHFPQIVGCIGATHVPVLPSSDNYQEFVNAKGWPSMILQGVVDHTYRFRNIHCRTPGSYQDVAALKESQLFRDRNHLLPQETQLIDDIQVPFMLLSDAAYPLLPWLLKSYAKDSRLTPEEKTFNNHHNSGRIHIEIAFARLRGRWRRLVKRIDVHPTFVPHVVSACCVLHNIAESNGESFVQSWLKDVEAAGALFPQDKKAMSHKYDSSDASVIRDILRKHSSQLPLEQKV